MSNQTVSQIVMGEYLACLMLAIEDFLKNSSPEAASHARQAFRSALESHVLGRGFEAEF